MNSDKSSLSKDLEELVNKSIEANKIFLSESTRLMRQVTAPGQKDLSNIFQPNFLTEAFNAYAKLNIQHLKNVLELSVSLAKRAGTQQEKDVAEEANTQAKPAPSFVLSGEAAQGGSISLSFVLDNKKEDAVVCKLVNTSYHYQPDVSIEEQFNTIFSPQSFTLNQGQNQKINIDIIISKTVKPGLYISDVQVQGFEPAYFSILLTVNEIPTKTSTNGRKKGK